MARWMKTALLSWSGCWRLRQKRKNSTVSVSASIPSSIGPCPTKVHGDPSFQRILSDLVTQAFQIAVERYPRDGAGWQR